MINRKVESQIQNIIVIMTFLNSPLMYSSINENVYILCMVMHTTPRDNKNKQQMRKETEKDTSE